MSGTIIPLYSLPAQDTWGRVIAAKRAHPNVSIMAVVNPQNGPGPARRDDYVAGIAQLIDAGIKVIGYVATGYGKRPVGDVEADVDRWRGFYPAVTGIFFDEMSNQPGFEGRYRDFSAYAKGLGYDLTMGNPGTDTTPSYVGTVDVIFIYENAGLPSISSLAGWHDSYDKRNFAIIPYAVPQMDRSFVDRAAQHVGYIYLQDDTMPNPWDTVPAYFNDLVAALSSTSGTIIPLYSLPTQETWSRVVAAKRAYPQVPIMAVVNPRNGPGPSRRADYVTGISQLINADVKVIGYVATGYGRRPVADVQADVGRWRQFYPDVTGIFFDQMSNHPGLEPYYKGLSTYAKSLGCDLTMGNPGADTTPSYVGTVDVLFIYQNAGLPSVSSLAGWHDSYDKRNFAIIPYGVPQMNRSFVDEAGQHVGYIYLQNDTLPNPWDTVPPYFNDLVGALGS
jgi:hypothetical protein